MSKTAARARGGDGTVARLKAYIKETRAEIGRVTWPTREQALRLTGIVLAVTAALAIFLALIDYIFARFIAQVMAFDPIAIAVAGLLAIGAVVWWIVSRRSR